MENKCILQLGILQRFAKYNWHHQANLTIKNISNYKNKGVNARYNATIIRFKDTKHELEQFQQIIHNVIFDVDIWSIDLYFQSFHYFCLDELVRRKFNAKTLHEFIVVRYSHIMIIIKMFCYATRYISVLFNTVWVV